MKISKGAFKQLIKEEVEKLQKESLAQDWGQPKKYPVGKTNYITADMDYISIKDINRTGAVAISKSDIPELIDTLNKLYRGDYTNLQTME